MSDEVYQVRLTVFEGPLDLLLQLIERERLDISAVSLAQVADQFLAHVRGLEAVEADTLADFLVIAARLVWIKSQALLPRPPKAGTEEEEEDPAEALARQLREYKRFREAAQALRELEEAGRHTYVRLAPPPELERRLATQEVSLADLLAAARKALADLPPVAIPAGVVVPFTLTIQDQIGMIGRACQAGRPFTFRSLLSAARHRVEVIVTLLAVLELIKRRQVDVRQDEPFGEIVIAPVPGATITLGETDDETNGLLEA
jgi:segregation and condensation protein A